VQTRFVINEYLGRYCRILCCKMEVKLIVGQNINSENNQDLN